MTEMTPEEKLNQLRKMFPLASLLHSLTFLEKEEEDAVNRGDKFVANRSAMLIDANRRILDRLYPKDKEVQ